MNEWPFNIFPPEKKKRVQKVITQEIQFKSRLRIWTCSILASKSNQSFSALQLPAAQTNSGNEQCPVCRNIWEQLELFRESTGVSRSKPFLSWFILQVGFDKPNWWYHKAMRLYFHMWLRLAPRCIAEISPHYHYKSPFPTHSSHYFYPICDASWP